MSVLLELAMFPTDVGTSKSIWVSKVIAHIRDSGYSYQLTPMGTIIETDTLDEALALVGSCYKQLEKDCERVYSTLTFDIRKGKNDRIKQKIKSVEEKIGKTNH